MIRIAHLLDDLGPGGAARFVDFLAASAVPGEEHTRVHIRRGSWSAPEVKADVIVSHLTVTWRALPLILSLRARHPSARIIHVEHRYGEGVYRGDDAPLSRFGAMLRTGYAMFDRVVAVNPAQGVWLREKEYVRDAKLVVIPPAVNLNGYAAENGTSGQAKDGSRLASAETHSRLASWRMEWDGEQRALGA